MNSKFLNTGNDRKKENPFSVPENYFENFPERMSNRISNDKKSVQTFSRIIHLKRYIAAAVIIIIALIGGYYFINENTDKKLTSEITLLVEAELYNISEETILDVMMSHQSESDNEEVENYLLESDIEDLYNTF